MVYLIVIKLTLRGCLELGSSSFTGIIRLGVLEVWPIVGVGGVWGGISLSQDKMGGVWEVGGAWGIDEMGGVWGVDEMGVLTSLEKGTPNSL